MIIRTLVAAVAVAAMGSTVEAADLGGNCCADLEERVAELESTVVRKGNRKVSVRISGQINQLVLFHDADGGDLTDPKIMDPGHERNESRLDVQGVANINSGLRAGFVLSLGFGDAINNSGSPDVRESYIFIDSDALGKILLGRAPEATEGIMELSLSRGASNVFLLGDLTPIDTYVTDEVGLTLDNPFDGTRRQTLRYVSPSVAGFIVSASLSNDEVWDISLRYAGEFGAFQVAAGIGYRNEEDTVDRTFVGGSASVMHVPTGLFVDGAYGHSDGVQTGSFTFDIGGVDFTIPFAIADTEVTTYGGRIGIEQRWIEAGKTTVFAQYETLDIDAADVDPYAFGLGINQQIEAAAMDIYLGWKYIDLDFGGDDNPLSWLGTDYVVEPGGNLR